MSRLLVLTCLILTIILYGYARKFEQMHAKFEFGNLTLNSANTVQGRVGGYAQLLSGIAAHLSLAGDAGLEGLDRYMREIELEQKFPDALGIGFVEARAHRPHADDLVLTNMVIAGDATLPLPVGQVIEGPWRKALEYAAFNGETVLSSGVMALHTDMPQARFVMARAVYDGAARKIGWIVVPFAGQGLFGHTPKEFGRTYHLTVYEKGDVEPHRTLFSSAAVPFVSGLYTTDVEVATNGQTWVMRFTSTQTFDQSYLTPLPSLLLVAGMFMTVFMALTLHFAALRSRMLGLAADAHTRQLGAREEENRALLETNVSVVITLDGDGHIAFANEAAADLFASTRENFEGRCFTEFVQLHDAPDPAAICNADGILPASESLLLDVQSNLWRTAEGESRTTVLIRDVTEQVNGRKTIEELHARYDVALTGAGIGIFEVDLRTGAAQVSDTWHKIMGTADLSVPFDHEKHFMARVHPDDRGRLIEGDRLCIEGRAARSVAEYRVRFDDGWRWMYSDAVPVAHGPDGRATRLIGTQADISALRHARNALELSEARFRRVLEDAPVGMAVLNETGVFLGLNNALASLAGYDVTEMRKSMQFSDLLSQEDFVQVSRDVRTLLRAGSAKAYQNQFRLRTRTGDPCWGLLNLSWTYDKNKSEHVYIAQIVDITDQKRLEQIKSEFVATVSHELRTPLTSIKGALSLLEMTAQYVLPDDGKRLLEIARVNTDRLTVIVNDILDLEKISSGDVVFEPVDALLDEVIADTLVQMTHLARETKNTLSFQIEDPAILVHVDVGRMRQALTNLVSNACKFSEPDTAVVVRATCEGAEAKICVENTGAPVSARFRALMFDAFTQADGSDTRSMGGAGLGLNIARQIVTRLGGQIGFVQADDRRTVFWFTCPIATSAVTGADPTNIPDQATFTRQLRILHVEDDPDFAAVVAVGFEQVAHIGHAFSLAQARTLAGEGGWDAVLLDWTLPDGTADQILDELEALLPAACIISLSADSALRDDPRITTCMTKSKHDIRTMVNLVVNLAHNAPLSVPADPIVRVTG
ncbi:MAG: PAS domain S-box protein [Sulfitobacter sp.]